MGGWHCFSIFRHYCNVLYALISSSHRLGLYYEHRVFENTHTNQEVLREVWAWLVLRLAPVVSSVDHRSLKWFQGVRRVEAASVTKLRCCFLSTCLVSTYMVKKLLVVHVRIHVVANTSLCPTSYKHQFHITMSWCSSDKLPNTVCNELKCSATVQSRLSQGGTPTLLCNSRSRTNDRMLIPTHVLRSFFTQINPTLQKNRLLPPTLMLNNEVCKCARDIERHEWPYTSCMVKGPGNFQYRS